MSRKKHQSIWKRNEKNELVLDIPNTIKTDVGYQLMFGKMDDHDYQVKFEKENAEKYETRIYILGNDGSIKGGY